uniref:Condensin-2 complex subunit H2 n=1 Tax=Pogona vitticeps TaxID=103695 RepID=A0ABM5GLF5_9SAUR
MEDPESRFLHFLQPIRDLTKNWEVDVAAQLGEYLEELEQICVSFDGGKTTMNFIEAALLIQGSACIYSKKVEYLYSLVYQALDFISNKKREKMPASVGEDGADTDAATGPAAEKEEFLSLNDIQDASKANMHLKDDRQPTMVSIVPLTPMSLVPPEEAEKKDNPLFSRKGEMLASRRDFRMNTCTPHTNGTFMLELAGLSPTQCPPARACEWGRGNSMGVQSLPPAAGSTPMEVSVCNTPVQALDFSGEGGEAEPVGEDDEGCDHFLPGVPEEAPEVSTAGVEERLAHQTSAPKMKGYVLRERPPAQDDRAHLKETLDPWRSLDPFSSSDEKPLKKGRPFTVPRGLEDLPGTKRKRRLSSKLQEFTAWFSAMEHGRACNQRSRRKGPTFADLEVLYWKHMKERLAIQKKLQKRMMQDPELARAFEEPPAREEEDAEEGHEDEDGDGVADDFLEQEDLPPLEAPDSVADPGDLPSSLSYEELVRKNVELFMAHSQKYVRETELSRRVRDWEEMMGPQLEDQEARAAFDIHDYGDRLASRLARVGEWRSFASLVAGEPAYEVCRYMLASLQLANDYTVEIRQNPGLDEAVDTMALRLLTQEKAHERFHTYTAPSLTQQ